MNATRLAILAILVSALAAGAGLYYTQVYAFYFEPTAQEAGGVTLVSASTGEAEQIPFDDFAAIDADSSPLRFRACFSTDIDLATLADRFVPYVGAVPLNAPRWFDCFDAKALGAALADGSVTAYLGQENISYGFDRVVAFAADGRGYVWHQINACGEVVFDGEPAPEGCPPVPEGLQ